ncbi:hypothetical protein GPECTOR_13g828 [Gonium pectorale]|uniref:Guanylate cyclase domain-containing protein n=1 Tax=Gonium pectorale TaxID=33097 RepID=A0A150GPS7_GONPE|nr:hypothetical protein GPECTOR_13g828 [Gonium pectorale]|eukprot:KXZ51340.1 hypothetical protein GPECTOR_13g828 [Gonium pectorale]
MNSIANRAKFEKCFYLEHPARLRVLAGTAHLYPVFANMASQFSAATGYFNYTFLLGASAATLRNAISAPPPIRDTDDESGGVDAIIASPTHMSSMYEVVALPVASSPALLLYHLPTFERDGLQVPVTWDQVLQLAAEYKGRDCFADGALLRWVFSSFVQTHGSSQGMFLDPGSLANLANSSAMAEALNLWRKLRVVSEQPPGDCTIYEDALYLRGRCLMSLTTHATFKAAFARDAPPAYTAMRGRMGMAMFPGSTRVLDRPTGRLVDCDASTCPLAHVTAPGRDGVMRPVNQPIPSSNIIVMINAQSPPKYQFYAYSLFSYLTSPHVLGTDGDALLLTDPRLETAPLRRVDLTPEAAAHWVARGYHPADVDQFFAAYRASLENPNQAFEPRFPGVLNVTLWEHLDAGVMDAAISVHHAVLRTAFAQWGGYESATEGDSFIVAFQNPTAALNCALAAQQALLDAPWPPGLLHSPPLPGLEGDEDPLMTVVAYPLFSRKPTKGFTQAPYAAAEALGGARACPPAASWRRSLSERPAAHDPAALPAPAPPALGRAAASLAWALPECLVRSPRAATLDPEPRREAPWDGDADTA